MDEFEIDNFVENINENNIVDVDESNDVNESAYDGQYESPNLFCISSFVRVDGGHDENKDDVEDNVDDEINDKVDSLVLEEVKLDAYIVDNEDVINGGTIDGGVIDGGAIISYTVFNGVNTVADDVNTIADDVNNNIIINGGDEKEVADVHKTLIPEKIRECSIISDNTEVCSSCETIKQIKTALKIKADKPKEIIEEAKKKTNCDTERCVIKDHQVLAQAGTDLINKELTTNFKIAGPTGIDLLTNHNIDRSLKQWQKKFPKFYAYNFNMRDFKNKGDTLATVNIYNDIYKQGYNTFGCVVNSDRYSGNGTHWMAIFGDFRNKDKFTVEFFNSSGQSPCYEFSSWTLEAGDIMKDIQEKEKLGGSAEAIKVCKVKQQNSRTECGPYSLYYIWARLNDVPYTFFLENRIEDQKMFEFRQHLFWDRSAALKNGETFAYEKFAEHYTPKWEAGEAPKDWN